MGGMNERSSSIHGHELTAMSPREGGEETEFKGSSKPKKPRKERGLKPDELVFKNFVGGEVRRASLERLKKNQNETPENDDEILLWTNPLRGKEGGRNAPRVNNTKLIVS